MSPQNTVNELDIKELFKIRKDAFTSLDERKIRQYMDLCGIDNVENPETFWKGVHMARAAMIDIPMELREKSIDWMIDNHTLFSFIPNSLTRDEKKEQLMHFYEVRYANELNS